MSSPFVAEIRMFAGNFAPTGWAMCDGQLLPISQNTALFSLLGTFYGGDGKSTFALPDLQGSAAMHQGNGAGLSQRFLGEQSGTQTVTLLQSEMPLHSHNLNSYTVDPADNRVPGPTMSFAIPPSGVGYSSATSPLVQMNFQELSVAGSSFPHNNMQPFLTVLFIIAMQGVFPPRG
ncbi:MAG: tail fiber protein [Thermoanaerobaculia bacterium]